MNNEPTTGVQIYSRLLQYVFPHWFAFLMSILGFLIYSMSNAAFVQLIGHIVDTLQNSTAVNEQLDNQLGAQVTEQLDRLPSWFSFMLGESGDLNRALVPIGIVLIALARGLGTFAGNYCIAVVSTRLVHALRCQLFERLLSLPSAYYDSHVTGHLVARVTHHVNQVTGAATDAVKVIVREGFTVLSYLGLLLYLNWKLTVIFFAVAPIIALLVSLTAKRFRQISSRMQHSMGDITHVATEAMQGYREVRSFGGEQHEKNRFTRISNGTRRQAMKMVMVSSIFVPVIQLIVATALAALVWLMLDPTVLSGMSTGAVVAFITTSGLIAKPVRQLSEVNAVVQIGLAAAEDIFGMFDEESERDKGEYAADNISGEITFKHVSFSYGEGLPDVLKDIDFSINPGETIALVGRSGSGKSTLASLVPRFYSPNEGEILLDGHPIESFTLENLRSHTAIVSQQVMLFNDTVGRNIAYGTLQNASLEEIKEAARKAYADDFINALPDGYDTIVGDDGVLLSGGQRQRLAIARAFLKDAPVLILDEATSALDTESERNIQKALEEVVKGRTTLVIAHRLSTIENADRIMVIDDGTIVEEGNHSELIAKNGFYAGLHAHDELDKVPEPEHLPAPIEPVARPLVSRGTLVDAWYNDAGWLRFFTPFAFIYRQLVAVRRRWLSFSSVWKAPVPLMVVGNINVGGTGKSPLVIRLVSHLKSLGLRPGVVTRGYGGNAEEYPVEVNHASPATEVGDEPLMIHNRTGCPVVVDPDRVAAAQHLLKLHDCDLIISDDGLQHYALGRDIEVAVVDGERGLGNGLCLPAGPLREPASRLREVDLVIVNGGSLDMKANGLVADVPIERMQLVPSRFVNLATGETAPLDAFAEKVVHGVAGIGNPTRFFNALQGLGCQVVQHPFDDHHRFTESDLAFGDGLPTVMTEKDAVRLPHLGSEMLGSLWYLEVDAELGLQCVNELVSKAIEIKPKLIQYKADPVQD